MTDEITERGGREGRGPWLRRATLNILALALGLALCEFMLVAAAALFPGIAFRLQPPTTTVNADGSEWVVPREIVPDPVLEFRLSRYSPRMDKWGYRNPDVPETCTVLALGDSMTFGTDVRPEESWPRVLSRVGGLCAYNAAVPGYGPVAYQVVLDETLRLRPRLVIVGLYLGNDIYDAFNVVYVRRRLPFAKFRNPDAAVTAEIEQLEREESLVARVLRLVGGMNRVAQPFREDTSVKHWLEVHSKVYALAREAWHVSRDAWQSYRGRPPPVPWEQNLDSFESATAKPHRVAWMGDPRFRTVFVDPEIGAIFMDLDDPRLREGQRITQAALVAMRDRAAREGASFLVLLIPTKESVYATKFDLPSTGMPGSILRLLAMEGRLRTEMTAFFGRASIPYVDALPALTAAFDDGVAIYNESDDIHPTAAGQAAIARALLPAVKGRQ